jgi:hypothetical protein
VGTSVWSAGQSMDEKRCKKRSIVELKNSAQNERYVSGIFDKEEKIDQQ